MKILIVYYSRTGNTKKVAEYIKDILGCDIEEIKAIKDYLSIKGWIMGGKEGSQKIAADIKTPLKNPGEYDLIVLGTPIWGWNIASPLRGYIMQNKDRFKKIAAFCTMSGSLGNTFEEIENICGQKLEAHVAYKDKDILANKAEYSTFLQKLQIENWKDKK